MFVVIEVGSSQLKVSEGDTVKVNRLANASKKTVDLNQVLLYAHGHDIRVGQPYLKDVKVKAQVLEDTLAEKRVAFKFRRRKGYTKKKGHRQKLTALQIKSIEAK